MVKGLIILVMSALFGLAHYTEQGVAGMEQAMMTGLTFGTIFAVTGSIFLPMIVHAAFDVAAVAIIYWDIEEKIAHLVFK
jgi:membrane protease YdiL (CAAX protease family)